MTPQEIKTALLGADDRAPLPVPTPEWAAVGLPVMHVLPLDGHGRDVYDQKRSEKKFPHDEQGNLLEGDWRGLTADLLVLTLCTAEGVLLGFTDLEVELLGTKNGAALDRCYMAAARASGLTADAVELAEKNSLGGPSANSGSSSASSTPSRTSTSSSKKSRAAASPSSSRTSDATPLTPTSGSAPSSTRSP